MKKLAVLVAVVTLAALAAPAFSATNPFMDVPMNHWAYDAIGQLAAHGIISGYPDGLFKGQQSTTRYEMASTVARALAVVDMTKASKQDVEMMKTLVVEFRDELEALGVRVDELDERVAVFEDRLGGWRLNGSLVFQIVYDKDDADFNAGPDTSFGFDEARIIFQRTWGEDDEYSFYARLRDEDRQDYNGGGNGQGRNARFDRFYVDMPFFFDSKLRVGRFAEGWENAYKIGVARDTGGYVGLDEVMTNWIWEGFGITKDFAIGKFEVVLAHPNGFERAAANAGIVADTDSWMLAARGAFKFTEQFGFDLGGTMFMGDNAEVATGNNSAAQGDTAFENFWMIFAGLNYNFNDNVAFKGVFYHQDLSSKVADLDNANNLYWRSYGSGNGENDDANHWALMVDVKQEALKYTSLWLEYGQYDNSFLTRSDTTMSSWAGLIGRVAPDDIKYYRVALGQEWNDKWATHLFYYGYDFDQQDRKPSEIGLGVQYTLNDYTTMGLNYLHVDYDQNGTDDDDVIRFRTAVSF